MTLIAGLLCTDGLLICSDTEESSGVTGDKGSVRKIFQLGYDPSYSLAIATAGHSALADVAIKRIHAAVKFAGPKFVSDHEDVIEKTLRTLYKAYVWPDDVPGDREISLIIGLCDRANNEFHLYVTCDEILQPKNDYACAGCGESIGNYFLERLYEHSLTVHQAMELMAFVAREAKDSVGAVGRETEMVTVRKDGMVRSLFTRSTDRHIPHLSQCINNFWKEKPKL
jgi:20S proteasome alpha/beta subunit